MSESVWTMLSFGNINASKGNQSTGFRQIPLTDKALAIVEKTHRLYPDSEYLFMRDNKQLIPNTINEELQRICKALGIQIPLQSSDKVYSGNTAL
ncbi:MAG: hypothetical protein ACI4TA_15620 [Acetatifactor sp.]